MRNNQTECRLFDKITIQINVAPKLEARYTILSYKLNTSMRLNDGFLLHFNGIC